MPTEVGVPGSEVAGTTIEGEPALRWMQYRRQMPSDCKPMLLVGPGADELRVRLLAAAAAGPWRPERANLLVA